MTKQPLNKVLKNYYDKKSLSRERIDRLEQMIQQSHANAARPRVASRKKALMIAAGFAALIPVSLFLDPWTIINPSHLGVEESIHLKNLVQSIVDNHIKSEGKELNTLSSANWQSKFAELPFKPEASLGMPSWNLLGGRYCSVGEQIAFQTQYRTASGAFASRFQTRFSEAFLELDLPFSKVENHFKVRAWTEGDVLWVEVSPSK